MNTYMHRHKYRWRAWRDGLQASTGAYIQRLTCIHTSTQTRTPIHPAPTHTDRHTNTHTHTHTHLHILAPSINTHPHPDIQGGDRSCIPVAALSRSWREQLRLTASSNDRSTPGVACSSTAIKRPRESDPHPPGMSYPTHPFPTMIPDRGIFLSVDAWVLWDTMAVARRGT